MRPLANRVLSIYTYSTLLSRSHAMPIEAYKWLEWAQELSKSRPETNHLWRMVITDTSAATHTAAFFRVISKLVGSSKILFYNDKTQSGTSLPSCAPLVELRMWVRLLTPYKSYQAMCGHIHRQRCMSV